MYESYFGLREPALGAYAKALRPVPPAFVEAKAKEIVTGRAVAPPKPDREEP